MYDSFIHMWNHWIQQQLQPVVDFDGFAPVGFPMIAFATPKRRASLKRKSRVTMMIHDLASNPLTIYFATISMIGRSEDHSNDMLLALYRNNIERTLENNRSL